MSTVRQEDEEGSSSGGRARGVATVGLDGLVVHANEAMHCILGLEAGTLVGRRLTDLLPLDDAPGDRRHVRPDGQERWLLAESRLETAPAGGDDHVMVVVQDVTEQRAAATAQRAGHALFRATVEGSWVVGPDGRTTAISPHAAAMLGYDADELIGMPVAELVEPEQRAGLAEALGRRRDGVAENYEMRWRHRDGHPVWLLMSAAPMHDPDGGYVGGFALVVDVTERREADRRLARHVSQQQAVAELGRASLAGADLANLFDLAARRTAEVLACEFATIFTPDADGALRLGGAFGVRPGGARDRVLSRAATPSDATLEAGEPVCIADWEAQSELALPPFAAAIGVRSTAAVPLRGRRVHGLLAAHRTTVWHAGGDELRFLGAVANVLAAAIDRAEAEEEVRRRTLHDPLTGLPNRALLLDRVAQALRRAAAGAGSVAVVVVDVDRFKAVNDTLGNATGDDVLLEVAARLRGAVMAADTIARLGGDEFAVLCEGLPDDAAAGAVALRVVEAFRQPFAIGGEWLLLTASVGVALRRGREDSAGELVRDAGVAMDRAKARGRDRFELFDEALRERTVARLALQRDLQPAAARGELRLVFQPVFELAVRRVIGVEALVRWEHPDRGLVMPADFIPLAEEIGAIGAIGAWVLEAACWQTAKWRAAGHELTCHVNLSPRQVDDPGLPAAVATALEHSGLPPEALVFEITETSVMQGGDASIAQLRAVHDLGVPLMLDDFGTGWSSLGRLRRCPIDGLKIDRSFVADLDGDEPADALIVAGIVSMARALGLTVVGEGIETEEQLRRLRATGCRYAQGYLLGRPCDAEAIEALL